MTSQRFNVVAAMFCAATLLIARTSAQSPAKPEEFSAIYSNISNIGAVGATPLTIRITRWTDAGEDEKLMSILRDKGNDAFVTELQNAKSVGSIGTPQQLPYDLRYARQTPTEKGGRRIILMTDRPMAFSERTSSSLSKDYPVTWIELRLDANDRGEGSISIATRLRLLGNVLGIEDLGNQPARLNEVKKIK